MVDVCSECGNKLIVTILTVYNTDGSTCLNYYCSNCNLKVFFRTSPITKNIVNMKGDKEVCVYESKN